MLGWLQATGGARFTREPLAHGRIVESLPQQLDGDQPIDGGIAGEVERTHAAVRDEAFDVVPPDDCRRLGHRPRGPRGSTAMTFLSGTSYL